MNNLLLMTFSERDFLRTNSRKIKMIIEYDTYRTYSLKSEPENILIKIKKPLDAYCDDVIMVNLNYYLDCFKVSNMYFCEEHEEIDCMPAT